MNKTELALDIAAFASILAKTGFEEILLNQKLFVEVCNEAGFRTVRGKQFTQMSFRQMMDRLPRQTKYKIKDLFSWGNKAQCESVFEIDHAYSV